METGRDGDFNTAAHALRGLAAALVFYAHIFGGVGENVYPDDIGYNDAIAGFCNVATASVFLFFIISGFVIYRSATEYSFKEFMTRRFVRIYPLFAFVTILFIVLNATTNRYPELNDPYTILAGLTFTNLFTQTDQLAPNAWSLSYEVVFYVLTAGGALLARGALRAPLLLVFSGLCLYFLWVYPKALFFLGGIGIRLLMDRNIRLPQPAVRWIEIVSLAAAIAVLSLAKNPFQQADFMHARAWLSLGLLVVFFYAAVHESSLTAKYLSRRFFFFLGTVSYSLYLIHPYVYLPARIAFEKLGLFSGPHMPSVFAFALVTTPVVLGVTYVSYLLFERAPYRLAFHQTVFRLRDTAPLPRRDKGQPLRASPGPGVPDGQSTVE